MTLGSDRLHRRRCLGFRLAFIFGILLAVINRDDWTLLSIALVGVAMIAVMPFVWGLIRRTQGLPLFGAPTVAELEGPRASDAAATPRPAPSDPVAVHDEAKLS